MSARGQRGFTLIEALVSTGIMAVAIAGAAMVLQAASVHHHNGKLVADAQGETRGALDTLSGDLLAAGLGGRIVVTQGGARRVISAVHGYDTPPSGGSSGSSDGFAMDTSGPSPSTPTPSTSQQLCGRDIPAWVQATGAFTPSDIFLVSTHANASFEARSWSALKGARGWMVQDAVMNPAKLMVDSNTGLTNNDMVLVSDFSTSLLLTGITLESTDTVNLSTADRASGIVTNDPLGLRPLQKGSALMRARVVHYYLCPDPNGKTVNLYRSFPTVCADAAASATAPVFCDEYNTPGSTATGSIVAKNIVSLDFRYLVDVNGQGNAADQTVVTSVPPESANGTAVRRVRVAVRGYSESDLLDASGRTIGGGVDKLSVSTSAGATTMKDWARPSRPYVVTVGIRNNLLNGNY